MKTFDDALNYLISQAIPTIKTQQVNIGLALGKTLAENIVAKVDVPAHDNSMMDGYALNVENLKNRQVFSVSQRIAAGDVGQTLTNNTLARIFTGAPIPKGANAVIMQEETEQNGDEILITALKTKAGQNIRVIGEDIAKNSIILNKGHKLRAQDLGLISSIGIAKVTVYKPLTIATFTSGNELLEPGEKLQEGKIYNANRYVLAGIIPQLGFELIDLGTVEDTLEATIEAMSQAAKVADIVITTGGVSVGEEDHIKPAIEHLGSLDLWKVKMKPGKPLAFGNIKGVPFIGLPGNPVSAFATFMLFARPYLLSMQGQTNQLPSPVWLPANFEWNKTSFRREFARAKLTNQAQKTWVEIHPNQSSGVLSSVVWADGFVVIPEDTAIKKGDLVAYYSFADLN
jgi:molybdopterin molybdotransferase